MNIPGECGTNSQITHCRALAFSFVTLTILILMVYSNSFNCSWHFDDESNILENYNLHMKILNWNSIKKAVFSDRNNPHFPYRPVACLSFALNHFLGGLDVFGYHVVNLLVHIIASLFLFAFIYRTLFHLTLKERWKGDVYFVSLLATVLWAINPIQTQAVTYIVQRMASMAAMFYIMGMYFYFKGRTAETRVLRTLFFFLCLFSFLLALGSKENAAMFPVSIFLYEALILQDNPKAFLKRSWKWVLVAVGSVVLVGAAYFYFKSGRLLPDILAGYENRPFTFGQRLLTQPRVLLFYISLLLYPMPTRLNIAHDFPISTSLFTPVSTALSILVIIALIAAAIILYKKQPLISFSILFFFVNHIIESSIFPLEMVFEHRNYFPSMMFFLPVSLGFVSLINYYQHKKLMKSIILGFIVFILISFGHSTYMRNFTWKNELTLWLDAVEKSPSLFRTHHNLAKYYQDHGFPEKALFEYEKALDSNKIMRKNSKMVAYYNMGKLYEGSGDLDKGLFFYNKALELSPNFPPLIVNIAAIYDKLGKPEKSIKLLKKAYRIDPSDPVTNYNMAIYYLKNHQPDEALIHLEPAVKSQQLRAQSIVLKAIALKEKGIFGRAVILLTHALNDNPTDLSALLHLSEIYTRLSRFVQAKKTAKKAVSLVSALDNDKKKLPKILRRLKSQDVHSGLDPNPRIVLPLLLQVIKERKVVLDNWQQQLSDLQNK